MWRSGRAWSHGLWREARHSVHIVIYVIWIITILTLLFSQCQKLLKQAVGRGKIIGDWSSILVRMPALIHS